MIQIHYLNLNHISFFLYEKKSSNEYFLTFYLLKIYYIVSSSYYNLKMQKA